MLAALASPVPGSPGPSDLPPELLQGLQVAGAALLAAVLLADVVIAALHLAGRRRAKSILAPRWSVTDIFIGLQLIVWLTLTSTLVVAVLAALVFPRAREPDALVMSLTVLAALALQQVAAVGTVALFVVGKYREGLDAVGFLPDRWPCRLLWGCAIALLALPVSDLLMHLNRYALAASLPAQAMRVVEAISLQADPQRLLEPLLTPAWLPALVLVIGILGPFGEEVFFRGFAYTTLKKRFGVAWAMALSSLLFALVHANPLALVPIFAIGLLLAHLYERTGTLVAPFALHALNNTVAVVVACLAPDFSFWDWLFPTEG